MNLRNYWIGFQDSEGNTIVPNQENSPSATYIVSKLIETIERDKIKTIIIFRGRLNTDKLSALEIEMLDDLLDTGFLNVDRVHIRNLYGDKTIYSVEAREKETFNFAMDSSSYVGQNRNLTVPPNLPKPVKSILTNRKLTNITLIIIVILLFTLGVILTLRTIDRLFN